MIRILIADRDAALIIGFRSIISFQSYCLCIDEAWTSGDLLASLQNGRYDLLVVEPACFGGTGEGLIAEIRQIQSDIKILVFTSMDELTFGARVIQAGAQGFLMKTCSCLELERAVACVGTGRPFISAELAEQLATKGGHRWPGPLHGELTEREFQVFAMIVCGKKITEIGNILNLSAKTVSTHKTRILAKLHFKSSSDIIQYAISQGLLTECETLYLAYLDWRAA